MKEFNIGDVVQLFDSLSTYKVVTVDDEKQQVDVISYLGKVIKGNSFHLVNKARVFGSFAHKLELAFDEYIKSIEPCEVCGNGVSPNELYIRDGLSQCPNCMTEDIKIN